MRAFIAIELPEDVKKEMAEIQRRLRGGSVDASWTRSEGIHLTLKFLGEIPEEKIPDIMNVLDGTRGTGQFRIEVGGVGTFPNPKNARVVWIGVSGEKEKLAMLQEKIEQSIAGLGMQREERPFTPHLTLGRIKYIRSKQNWLQALEEMKNIKLPGFDVEAVSLMKSELRREGAVYTEVGRVELK